MRMILLGDVHGNFVHCKKLAQKNTDKTIVQIGDLGVGFVDKSVIDDLPSNFRYFCDNHDKRSEFHTNCLGDYGEFNGIFFVSGADSIDKNYRVYNLNWWPDEELTYIQLSEAMALWEKSRCEILVSHDAPQSIAQAQYGITDVARTREALDAMISVRKPKMLVYGHHHVSRRFRSNDIDCVGLGIDEAFEINT